ncbi:hypothetical protein CCACVL1_29281 [Corchorus capsularis]|uniref:Uncharacterized protein n=1 Tax=Corchorus capsularis TaxID=210143 RepID=A0A1R3G2J8_COCAP|nr:hypothetical protein CCACVL1_29281 [Corchorus capsularis]
MGSGAAEMMFRCVFEGSIVMQDTLIERRPYHRNCGCALHKLKGACSSTCFGTRNLSFPKKHKWNECSLSVSISASKFSSQSSLPVDDSSVCSQEDAIAVLCEHWVRS